jgi:uncharacterized membrane protein YccC
MQGSVGASLRAMFDRFIGSLGGAIWGLAMLMAFNPSSPPMTVVAMAVTLAPLALLVALRPAFRPAIITAMLLLLSPGIEATPLTLATQRILGISLGSVIALAVALTVFPSRAHATLSEAAGKVLRRMGDLFDVLMKGPTEAERSQIPGVHADIRELLAQVEAAADAAGHERRAHLTGAPDPQPLCRTLRRLYHDLAMVGRATAAPLPTPLAESVSAGGAAISEFFRAIGESITAHRAAPALDAVDTALAKYTAALAQLRQTGDARELPTDELGRMFGLAFTLEQLHRNLSDLVDRTNELSGVTDFAEEA